MTANLDLRSEFARLYGGEPRIFRAPGRVNLIGEHTDYNDGFVMPAALEFATRVAIEPAESRVVEVFSINYNEKISFDLDEPNPRPGRHWSDYVRGVAIMLEAAGHKLRGARMVVEGGVPIGSGLSSSAALEVATALALLGNSGIELERTAIALLCQKAENEFVGAHTGIMDQFIACYGQADHALLLDCRSLGMKQLRLPEKMKLVIFDTKVKHDLAAGEYNVRRAECEEGVRELGQFIPDLKSLRDVTVHDIEQYGSSLDPLIYKRVHHVVTENARVQASATALEAGDLRKFGRFMIASHRSLRDDYEVSCGELDAAVDIALRTGQTKSAVYGARMTGGGFGGSTVNCVDAGFAFDFANILNSEYKRVTGITGAAYVCSAADGAAEELTQAHLHGTC
jgi:galactokinase